MLDADTIRFFDERGYTLARVFEAPHSGRPRTWQCTLWHGESQRHVHESAGTPIEAVAAMVFRLGGNKLPEGTGKLEGLRVALAGLTRTVNSAISDLSPLPEPEEDL